MLTPLATAPRARLGRSGPTVGARAPGHRTELAHSSTAIYFAWSTYGRLYDASWYRGRPGLCAHGAEYWSIVRSTAGRVEVSAAVVDDFGNLVSVRS